MPSFAFDFLVHCSVIFLLVLPWMVILRGFLKELRFYDVFLLSAVVGMAGTVSVGFVLAQLKELDYFGIVYLMLCLAALVAAVYRFRQPKSNATCLFKQRGDCYLFLGTVLGIAVCYAIPVLATEYPLGWDPGFHCILAQKILDSSGLVMDWSPFEAIEVNYTQGVHVFAALLSGYSGTEVHLVFQHLHWVIQLLAVLWVHRLAICFWKTPSVALLAMVIYACLFRLGSFSSYYIWGGFPTQLSAVFFLTLMWLLIERREGRSMAVAVLLFGGILFTHHLTSFIVVWVLCIYMVLAFLMRTGEPLPKQIFKLLFFSSLVYSFYWIPYAMKSMGIEQTDAMRFYEESVMSWPTVLVELGPIAFVLGVLGIALAWRDIKQWNQVFLLVWFTALMLGFCFFGYLYRLGAWFIVGEDFTAFTPTRFLTFTSYPLAIFAGFGLARLIELGGQRLLGERSLERWTLGMCGLAVIAIFLSYIPVTADLEQRRSMPPLTTAIASKVSELVPEDGIVLYDSSVTTLVSIIWMPYLTWRQSAYTPIPASEDRKGLEGKREALKSDDPQTVAGWIEAHQLSAYVVNLRENRISVALFESSGNELKED